MRSIAYLMAVGILMLSSCRAQTTTAATPPKLGKMPESLEIRFASSAAPLHLRDNATIYVLDPAKGYVIDRQGTTSQSLCLPRIPYSSHQSPA